VSAAVTHPARPALRALPAYVANVDGSALRAQLIASGQLVPNRWNGDCTWMPWLDRPTFRIAAPCSMTSSTN